jgi:hypothetical protein
MRGWTLNLTYGGPEMRVRSVLSVLSVVAAALGTTALTVTGAVADVGKVTEGSGDVFVVASSGDAYLSEQSINIDLTRHSVSHGKKIVIKSRYTDLVTPEKGDLIVLRTEFKVKGGATYTFTAAATSKAKKGTARLFTNNAQATCKGMKVKFDYDTDTAVARVPTSCLRNPAWLRYYTQASLDSGSDYFNDRAGSTTSGYREKPNYSPKLSKG